RKPGRCSRAGCARFSTGGSGWPLGLLASLEEAAGEIVYVRRGSMLAARLGGKIGHADLDATAGAGGPHVRDLAPPDEPREVALDVPRDPSGLGEVHDPVGFREECGFDLGRCPLEGARGALGAKGRTELCGLGADVGDCLVNGATLRTQKDTPPEESCSSGGVLARGGLCARYLAEVKACS